MGPLRLEGLRLVRREIVKHDLDLELGVQVRLDLLQEPDEVLGPVLWLASRDDLAGSGVQGGEEVERAVAQIGVGAPLRYAEIHRENRLRAFERRYAEVFAERFRGVSDQPYEQGFELRLVLDMLLEPLRCSSRG